MKQFLTRKSTIALAIFTSVLLFAFSGSHPTTGTGGYTGAPQDNVCTTCHTPGGSLDGTLEISGLPALVEPNTTYPLVVTITDTSPGGVAVRAGFQMVSLKSDLANGGTFSVPASENNAQVKTVAGKSYIGHQPAKNFNAADQVVFNVDWESPATATGDITIYAATIVANGANGNSNDKFVATNVTTELDGGGAPLSATFSNVSGTSCSDTNDGSATINASGGSGGYSYNWDNGESGSTAIMLDGGDHNVTITDASMASIVETVNINSPPAVELNLVSSTDVECNSGNTGTAEVFATGGNGGFTYDWGNGILGSFQDNLTAGTYNVIATDINNCSQNIEVIINEPPAIVISVTTTNEPSCNGDSDGNIVVDATGGNGGFSYSWITGGIGNPNGASITDLPAGTYLLEVFDSEGCSNETEITLDEPDIIQSIVDTTDALCFDSATGSASIISNGGTGNITYEWSSGATGSTDENLSSGDYTVTSTDANGCNIITSFSIGQPDSPVEAGITATELPNCGNADGTLSAFGSGGSPDYTFTWNDGSTSAVLTNITAGTYMITVTDQNGCTDTFSFELMDNGGVTLAANDVVNNDCSGDSSGSATISASGGDGDYSYNWSNGGTNATENDLSAGTYSVTVTDGNNCSGEISLEVTEPEALMANETITDINCNGAENGSIALDPSGGTGDLSINWGIGSTATTIVDLIPGAYNVTITDENNCSEVFQYVIVEPESITGAASASSPSCVGDQDGSLTVTLEGGTGDLSLHWSTGDTTQTINNLEAGDYELTVTDENGCETIFSFTLDPPLPIMIGSTSTSPSCFDSSDGSIDLNISGGTPEYTFLWEDMSTNSTLENIPGGTYDLTVTDANGCARDTSISLQAPLAIDPNITSVNETANGANDGSASADPQNGVEPYEFLWENGNTTASIDELSPGSYGLTITDSNGCTAVATAIINNGDCNLSANPIINDISCFGLTDGSISLSLEGAIEPIEYEWSNDSTQSEITGLVAGMYSVLATDANGCQIQVTDIEIQEPSDIMATDPIITDASSSTSEDGSIEIEFEGGSGDLSIEYTDGNGNLIELTSFENLGGGSYGALVTDENGCTKFFGPFIVEVTTSATELPINAKIYPIPTSSQLTISTNKVLTLAPTVFTLSGQVLSVDFQLNNTIYIADLSTLSNGVYYVKLVSDKNVELKKIIVNR